MCKPDYTRYDKPGVSELCQQTKIYCKPDRRTLTGKGYKKIAKALNVPGDNFGSIFRKFKVKRTMVTTWSGQKREAINGCKHLRRQVKKKP